MLRLSRDFALVNKTTGKILAQSNSFAALQRLKEENEGTYIVRDRDAGDNGWDWMTDPGRERFYSDL